jgi:hypothetical protein
MEATVNNSSPTICSTPKQIAVTTRRRQRQRVPGSKRWLAEQTGISVADRYRIERHVALAEQYPFLQRAAWKRTNVLTAGALLARLPVDERARIVGAIEHASPTEALRQLAAADAAASGVTLAKKFIRSTTRVLKALGRTEALALWSTVYWQMFDHTDEGGA